VKVGVELELKPDESTREVQYEMDSNSGASDAASRQATDLIVTNTMAVLGGVKGEEYRVVPGTSIGIAGDKITWIGSTEHQDVSTATTVIDAAGKLAVPGLISSHNHVFQNLCKGLGDEMNVLTIVEFVILATAERMTPDDIYTGALACCVEGVRSGRTALLDFMVGLPDIDHQRAVVRAFEDSGVRGVLGRATREVYYEARHRDPWAHPLSEAFAQIKQLASEYSNGLPLPSAIPAPGSAHTMTLDGLAQVTEYARAEGCQVTIHLAEYPEERQEGIERWGKPTIAQLEEIGFWGPHVVAAHSVLLDQSEMEIFARTGAQISYNPICNCYCGVGIPPIVPLLEMGVDVSLAVDGASVNNQNMIESMKFGALLQKVKYGDERAMSARDMLRLSTSAGAKALGVPDLLGALEVGRLADLFLFDLDHINTAGWHDPISALVYMGAPHNVDTVIIGGEVVLKDGRSTRLDEDALVAELQERALALARRAGTTRYVEGRRLTPFTLYHPQILHLSGTRPTT
jgi:5-methylthioadenosine/S-adenosylhomocysteine deaminase